MTLTAKEAGGGGDFTLADEGTHLAICNMVVDLGLQRTTWQDEQKIKPQVYIRWELPNERIEYEKDGEQVNGPMTVGRIYTMSLGKKANLRHDLEAWRGRTFTSAELEGFDLANVAGKPCQITITHRQVGDKTYANVVSVAGWPKGMDVPTPENEVITYDSDVGAGYDLLPEWLQKKIDERVIEEPKQAEPVKVDYDDGVTIPF